MKRIFNNKILLIIISLLLIFSCKTTQIDDSNITEIVILHTNDTHGHPLKFFDYPAPDVGGIPARATLINEIRNRYQNVLVLDAGDINTGRPESSFFKAEPDIIGYNYIGYDAAVFGNHEFDNSNNILLKQISNAKFEFISANVKKKNGNYLTKPYIIKEFDGIKVGVFGLTTKETAHVVNPENISDLVFLDEIESAKEIVTELKSKGVDIIIAVTHLGIYEDSNEGSKKIAKNVKGIDLIVDGHTHSKLDEPVYINNTPIVQSWQWGLVLGKGIMKIKNKKIIQFKWEAVPINLKRKDNNELKFITKEIEEDKIILAQLDKYQVKVEKILGEVIGNSNDVFLNKDSRLKETALGDFVADSMLWYTKKMNVDFALQNGGGIRTDIPSGKITKRTIYEVIPFDNSVVVLSIKGSDVKKLFDYIATIKQGDGAFPQVSDGVSFILNYDTGKCENILINEKPIDLKKTYKIATNGYLAIGGNGYEILKKSMDTYDTSRFQRDIIIDYIKFLGGKIEPVLKNRIKIIGKNMAFDFKYNYYFIAA